MKNYLHTLRKILACLAVVSIVAVATSAQAQIFSDDDARAVGAANSEKIDTLGRVVNNLRAQLASMLQQQQILEQEMRELSGRIKEKEVAGERSVDSTRSLEENVVRIGDRQGILVDEVAGLTAEILGQVSLISGRLSEIDDKTEGVDGQLLTLSVQLSSMREQLLELSDIIEIPREDDMYAVAFSAHQRQAYSEAIAGFQKILRYYPEGAFAVNARYWMSQALLSQGEYALAAKEAMYIYTNNSDSDKVPDTLLVLARAQQALEMEDARAETLNKLIENYPTSLAADQARQMLYP